MIFLVLVSTVGIVNYPFCAIYCADEANATAANVRNGKPID